MGEIEVCITYNSPDVREPSGKSRRGEKWGKLVPYRLSEERWIEIGSEPTVPKPWRAGANENSMITFSHDVLILSKDSKKWGAYL